MKIGIVFSGQGAQYSGMGKELYDAYPEAREIFDAAGEEITQWCFNGDEETLKETRVTQPTIYTTTMAAYKAFVAELKKQGMEDKIDVTAFAGFSLGEYSALTAAGAIDSIDKGVNIVTKRGLMMNEAGMDEEGNPKGGMTAAIGDRALILEAVEEAREDGILEGVNFNSAAQTVVAGDKEALKRFRKSAKERKLKAIPLKVGTAFHSPMMIPAAEKLKEVLEASGLKKPEAKVYANTTAEDIMKDFSGDDTCAGEYLCQVMSKQAMSPVFWEETIKHFVADGVDAIVEIGPGKTLTGLTEKIAPEVKAMHVENIESLNETIDELKKML